MDINVPSNLVVIIACAGYIQANILRLLHDSPEFEPRDTNAVHPIRYHYIANPLAETALLKKSTLVEH